MKKSLLLISAFALCFSACNSLEPNSPEDVAPAIEDAQESSAVTGSSMPDVFYASVDAETKAGFIYDSVNKKYSHYWNEGDIIYVFHETYRRTYSCTDAANGVFSYVDATEVSVSPKNYTKYCAVFNTTNSTAPSAYNHNVVSNVWQGGYYMSTSTANGYANIMVANSTDEHLNFKNIVGWLKLRLKGWKSVSSIDIVSGDYKSYLNGTYRFTFNADGTIDIVWNEDDYTGNTVSFPSPVALNFTTPTDFYLALPECSMNGVSITIHYSDSSSDILSTENTVTITRNNVTPMATCFTRAFTDLTPDTSGAMTYIISASGYYKFNAKTPVSGYGWKSDIVTTSATLLWETDNTSTPVSSGDIIELLGHDDHFIYFKTADSFKEGNALIKTNNYCYHIWCTDTPADINLTGSVTIMDRNLGALSADPTDGILSQGLYYQLFRPVPFPGNHATTAAITTAAPAGWEVAKDNPTVFYIKSESTDKSWLSKTNNVRTIYTNWFPTSSSSDRGYFDPCPAGYRLMTTPVGLTGASTTGGNNVTGTNTSFFPEGHIWQDGSYQSGSVSWFNHTYNATYIYVSAAVGTEIQMSNSANEFKGYQLRCQKQ